jgi:hypothetical protein
MNKKIAFLMCFVMVTVWTAGCTCPGPRRPAPPPVVVAPPPPPPPPEVAPPKPPVEYSPPSKKLKERVYY